MKKSMKLGGGGRFRKLVNQLKKRKVGRTARGRKLAKALLGKTEKVKNPAALAAWIGRKKYGKEKFQEMSIKARLHNALRK